MGQCNRTDWNWFIFFLDKRRKIFLVGPPSTPAPSDVNYIGTSTKYIQHMGNIAKSARKGQDCVTTNVFGWFYNISWKIIDKVHILAQIEMMLMFCFFPGWWSNETITRFLVWNVNTWSHTSQVNIELEKIFSITKFCKTFLLLECTIICQMKPSYRMDKSSSYWVLPCWECPAWQRSSWRSPTRWNSSASTLLTMSASSSYCYLTQVNIWILEENKFNISLFFQRKFEI